MSSPRQVKTCPRCGTMAFLDSRTCAICGHMYHTDADVPRPVLDANRTQMMTLPPAMARPDRERVLSAEEDFPLSPPELPREQLNTPAILMAVAIALLLFIFVWWFVRQL